MSRPRVLIHTLEPTAGEDGTLHPEPPDALPWEVEVLAIEEEGSGRRAIRTASAPAPTTSAGGAGVRTVTLRAPVPLSHGLRRKLAFEYAVERRFDVIVTVPGLWAVTPEILTSLVSPSLGDPPRIVLARLSRRRVNAPARRFPLRPECESWPVSSLERLPFARNRNGLGFDADLRVQIALAGLELERTTVAVLRRVPQRRRNQARYLFALAHASLLGRLQSYGILYRPRFDIDSTDSPYTLKTGYDSSHTLALAAVRSGERVLDLGCGPGHMARELHLRRSCRVTAVDRIRLNADALRYLERQIVHDLDDDGWLDEVSGPYDAILILDVIEHLRSPERFLEALRSRFGGQRPRVILTTANIAFLPVRFGLLLGIFNYGPRGILDLTHCRLFTFGALRAALEQSGLVIEQMRGIPAPFPLALGDNRLARLLIALNKLAIRLSASLFSYQIFVEASVTPTLRSLLEPMDDLESRP